MRSNMIMLVLIYIIAHIYYEKGNRRRGKTIFARLVYTYINSLLTISSAILRILFIRFTHSI